MTQKEFIEKAILVHGDKYSYEYVEYVNSSTKVTITCKVHGTSYKYLIATYVDITVKNVQMLQILLSISENNHFYKKLQLGFLI